MPWRNFWKRDKRAEPADAVTPEQSTPPAAPARALPPHVQRIVGERKRPATPAPDDLPAKRARLERQRLAILFDVDQGELAEQEENPWSHRITLLTEALATVDADRARLRTIAPSPYWPIPATPITGVAVEQSPPFSLAFRIGDVAFRYEEDLDWAERGHQLALPELQRTQGSVAGLLPPDLPAELTDDLRQELDQSLDVFAADLRDRHLDGEAFPEAPTLADLARPCPTCGGWIDWRGHCAACAARAAEELRLNREQRRLLDERAREAEERHRLRERLPLARRRLADVDAELAALDRATPS